MANDYAVTELIVASIDDGLIENMKLTVRRVGVHEKIEIN